LLKDEQEQEQPRKQGKKQAGNSSGRRFSRAMLAAWRDSTEEEEGTEEEEAAVALMARSDSESNEESLDSLDELKEQVCGLSKAKLKELLFTLMDEYDALTFENCMLKDVCAEIKKKDIKELEHENKILKSEKVDLDMKHLVLRDDLNKIKETLSLKEEAFTTDFVKLESESLELTLKVKSLLDENNKLLDKLNQVELDLAANR